MKTPQVQSPEGKYLVKKHIHSLDLRKKIERLDSLLPLTESQIKWIIHYRTQAWLKIRENLIR